MNTILKWAILYIEYFLILIYFNHILMLIGYFCFCTT